MPSLTKKIIRGRAYYYARECKRVDGKPKIVWQKYLGRAEDIIAAVTESPSRGEPPAAQEAVVAELGAVAALYDLAHRLDLAKHIDRHVPKRGAGPTVGTYLLVAAINRCVAPCSKAAMAEWFEGTALRRWVDIESRQLSSQRFWENMDRVSAEAIEGIEAELSARLVGSFDIDLRRVLFDATNFFTFIDSFNERSTLAQRGKSKEGRASLRVVGLALLVTADFHLPLLHHTYPGNQPDAPTFASLTSKLAARLRALTDGTEHITIVFDKGNNSKENLEAVEGSPYHFVGSLVPNHHSELPKVPAKKFESLADDGLPGVRAYRTTKEVFGATRTVVVTYNEKLFVAQSQTLLREIAKRQQRLRELQERLRLRSVGKIRGGEPPTLEGIQKKVQAWLSARHMKELFQVDVTEDNGLPVLRYRFQQTAWRRLQRTLLGKTILFTDNDDWTDAEIVHAYRAQHHVEAAFRTMKDPLHISIRPQHHWTDQTVRVHVFTCVLALMLSALLRRELHQRGIDLSIPDALDRLGKIKEVAVVYAPEGKQRKPRIRTTTSAMTSDQRTLYDALELSRYATT